MQSRFELQKLTDEQLTRGLKSWHGRERTAQAAVIAHLVEVERRKLCLLQGYPSLFAFCTKALGMSEDVAGTCIGAVRVARDYPCVLEMLADGRLYLSGIRLLRPHLTSETAAELLQAAAGLSKREIEKLLAHRFPKQDVKTCVRKLPQRQKVRQIPAVSADDTAKAVESADTLAHTQRTGYQGVETPSPSSVPGEFQPSSAVAPQIRQEQRHHQVTPLSSTRYKVTFTAGVELLSKLEQAKALLSHAIRDQSLEAVILRALTMLVEAEEKRRFGAPRKNKAHKGDDSSATDDDPTCPGASPASDQPSESAAAVPGGDDTRAPSRYIPAAVRREVYERDGHCCTYRSPDNKRCNETRFLEFDHVDTPWAQGGAPTAENLTLRCGGHNRWAANQRFGSDYVQARIRERKQIGSKSPAQPTEYMVPDAYPEECRNGGVR